MKKGYGEITQLIYRVGLCFLGSALPLIAIYLLTKFHLNTNSSFKVIRRTRYQTDRRMDGQSGDYMLPPLGSLTMHQGRLAKYVLLTYNDYLHYK